MAGDRYNLAQLTKDIVTSRFKEVANAPAAAAEIAKETIVASVRGTLHAGQNPQETVKEVCFGAMSGLLLIEKDLPQGTVQILQCLSEAAQELHLDPAEVMTWGMESAARVGHMASAEVRWKIRAAIEDAFMGTGQVFDDLCEKIK